MSDTETVPYTDHDVWDDESGERVFIDGHVRPERRAIAAANHWARDCGLANLLDDKSAPVSWVTVSYQWTRPDPQVPGDDESYAWCSEDHSQAQPITVLSW